MSMIMIWRHAHVLLISQYWFLRVNIHSKSLESIDHQAPWLATVHPGFYSHVSKKTAHKQKSNISFVMSCLPINPIFHHPEHDRARMHSDTWIMWPLISEWTLWYATPQCVGMLLTFYIIQVMWRFDVWK